MLGHATERLMPRPHVVSVAAVSSAEEGRSILGRVRAAISNAAYADVDVRRIRPMPGQPRGYFNPDKLDRLADSIKTIGQVTPGYLRVIPLDVEGRDYELIDGERRLRAILQARVPTYRAMIVDIDDAAAQYIVSVIANFNREGHTTLEIADAIRVMHEQLKLKLSEIAESIGYSSVHTANLYSLRRLVPMVRAMLEPDAQKGRKLPTQAAIEISRLPASHQYRLAERVLQREITLRTLRDEVVQISVKHDLPVQRKILDPHAHRQMYERKADVLARGARDLKDRLEEARPKVLDDWTFANRVACLGVLENARADLDAAIHVLKLANARRKRD
jgi:ParB/RepB/Spo0J family partition protein